MTDRDLGRLLLRASDLELGSLGWGGPQSGRNLGIVEDSFGMEGSWGRKLDFEKVGCGRYGSQFWCLRNGGSPEKARRGGGSGMNSGTLWISQKKLQIVWTHVIIVAVVKF